MRDTAHICTFMLAALAALAAGPVRAADDVAKVEYKTGYGALALTTEVAPERRWDGTTSFDAAGVDAAWQHSWQVGDRTIRLGAGYGGTVGFGGRLDLDQQVHAGTRIRNALRLPALRRGLDLDVRYDAPARAVGRGTADGSLRLAAPLWDGVAAETRLGVQAERGAASHGYVDLGVEATLGPANVSLSQDVDVAAAPGRPAETGLDLALGPHRIGLQQQVRGGETDRGRVGETGLAYRWQRGAVDLSLGARYTPAARERAAQVFAGIALSLGRNAPGAAAILSGLR